MPSSIDIVKPRLWCPGIRGGHPLCRGLVLALPMWEAAGTRVGDLSGGGRHGTLYGSSAWQHGGGGPHVACVNGGANYVALPNGTYDLPGRGAATVWARVRPAAGQTNTDGAAFFLDRGVADTTRIFLNIKADRTWSGAARSSAEASQQATDNTPLTNAATADLAVVCRLAENRIELWRDGARTRNQSVAFSQSVFADTTTVGSRVGRLWYVGSYNFAGSIIAACLWNRALSGAEIALLSADPWEMFRPRRRMYVLPPSPPASRGYRLYWGEGGLDSVNFAGPIATVQHSPARVAGLAPAAGRRHTLVLRPFADGVETPDLSCSCELETDAGGEWLGSRPASVDWLAAEALSGGRIELRWHWQGGEGGPGGGAEPATFALYCRDSRQIVPGAPDALPAAAGVGEYSHTFTLPDGASRWFAVAARTAEGVEGHLSRVIGPYVADASPPAAPPASVEAVA
jgi:hypothetical protein